ncbi:uncharacterized protein LOC115440684 isoform X3 [Manduca sexta]|nr:uncharacterized protein LOC115440684 isoform X3 [Manduca sexta]
MSTSAYKCKDCFSFASQYPSYDSQVYEQPDRRIAGRSAQYEHLRTNERSLPVYSETQRIQAEERRRHSSRLEEPRQRAENGSYKILNNPPKPCITNRRTREIDYPETIGEYNAVNKCRPTRGQIDSSNDRVVFPGPTSERSYVPEVPEECKKIGICDSIPNYPEEHVANIISRLGDKGKVLQIDELDVSDTPDIAQRLGPQEDNMELCSFREKIFYPKAAPDKDGNWFFVVNSKENPVQGYKVEICDRQQLPCAEFASFQQGYEARCIQKYVRRTMLALDPKGQMTDMPLKVPSCCSCVAKLTII